MKKRFVLIDRDGTIIVHKHHLVDINDVELIPRVEIGIKKLNDLGLGVIMLTNQTVVGNGHISLIELELIHKKILDLLSKRGAKIDGIYFCPHKIEDNCLCRKPKIGLIEQALKDYDFDPKKSFVIGDNKGDIQLGKNIEATTILVRTGYGLEVEEENLVKPDYIVDDLGASLPIIKKVLP